MNGVKACEEGVKLGLEEVCQQDNVSGRARGLSVREMRGRVFGESGGRIRTRESHLKAVTGGWDNCQPGSVEGHSKKRLREPYRAQKRNTHGSKKWERGSDGDRNRV